MENRTPKPQMVKLCISIKLLDAGGNIEEMDTSESALLTRGHADAAINWLQNAWKESADNALIATLCNSVRLAREHCNEKKDLFKRYKPL